MKILLTLICALFLLTGCKGEKKVAEETLPPVMYQCQNMQMIATFTKTNKLAMLVMGKTYNLLPAPAASGSKYETIKDTKPYAMFWSKGGEALIQSEQTGQLMCKVVKQKNAATPAEPAAKAAPVK